MSIYIIEIPGSNFTGFFGGLDYNHGRASTNSKADAELQVSRFGHRIVEVVEDLEVIPTADVEKPEAKARKDDAAPLVFVNRADRKAHEKLVRRLPRR